MSDGGRRVPWRSSITEVAENELRTYGVDQRTIIRELSFEETVFLVLRGRRPEPLEGSMLRAVLVSTASHGITGQSTMAAIAAADCRSGVLNALVAGFSVGAGDVHLGATAAAMAEFERLAGRAPEGLVAWVDARLAEGGRVTGFGHRFHERDPRARELLALADELGFGGPHLAVARRLEELLLERKGAALNVAGCNAAILLDLGFDRRIAEVFIVLGRSAMLAAAYLERLEQDLPPFPRVEVADVLPDA